MREQSKRSSMVRVAVLALAACAALAVSACNTVEGAGKDLQEGSRSVKEAISN